MLRIGKLTDYAMLILSKMAKEPDCILSANDIADAVHLSGTTVSKILKMLAEANLVRSIRGAEGGYQLRKAPQKISLAEIIQAMEGYIAITECCDKISLCNIEPFCGMRKNWQKINKIFLAFLTQLTLFDLLKPSLEFTKLQ